MLYVCLSTRRSIHRLVTLLTFLGVCRRFLHHRSSALSLTQLLFFSLLHHHTCPPGQPPACKLVTRVSSLVSFISTVHLSLSAHLYFRPSCQPFVRSSVCLPIYPSICSSKRPSIGPSDILPLTLLEIVILLHSTKNAQN